MGKCQVGIEYKKVPRLDLIGRNSEKQFTITVTNEVSGTSEVLSLEPHVPDTEGCRSTLGEIVPLAHFWR